MPRVLPPTTRRTLIVFATFSGLLLSMAQSCETGCGPSAEASPRATVDSSGGGGQYFRDRAQGYDGTGSTRVTTTRTPDDRTCTPGTRPTTTKTTTKRPGNTSDDSSGNNGSAFDEGYDKGYDEGYDDGRADSRRKDTDGGQDDDDR